MPTTTPTTLDDFHKALESCTGFAVDDREQILAVAKTLSDEMRGALLAETLETDRELQEHLAKDDEAIRAWEEFGKDEEHILHGLIHAQEQEENAKTMEDIEQKIDTQNS